MAIIQSAVAATAGGSAIVDPTFQAMRTSNRPPEILGAYSMSMVSGNITVIAAGSTSVPVSLFSFRWAPATSTQLCMIRRVEVGFNTITAFGAAQSLQYNMVIARNFTVNQSGGTSASFAQTNTGKHRTVMPTSALASGGGIQMATTTALAGTSFTVDSQYFASVNGTSTTIGTSIPMTPIYQHQTGDYPLMFATNEGFLINNGQLMGATGVGNLIVNVEWMELPATAAGAAPISY